MTRKSGQAAFEGRTLKTLHHFELLRVELVLLALQAALGVLQRPRQRLVSGGFGCNLRLEFLALLPYTLLPLRVGDRAALVEVHEERLFLMFSPQKN